MKTTCYSNNFNCKFLTLLKIFSYIFILHRSTFVIGFPRVCVEPSSWPFRLSFAFYCHNCASRNYFLLCSLWYTIHSCEILLLIFHWKPHWMLICTHNRCSLENSKKVLLIVRLKHQILFTKRFHNIHFIDRIILCKSLQKI